MAARFQSRLSYHCVSFVLSCQTAIQNQNGILYVYVYVCVCVYMCMYVCVISSLSKIINLLFFCR